MPKLTKTNKVIISSLVLIFLTLFFARNTFEQTQTEPVETTSQAIPAAGNAEGKSADISVKPSLPQHTDLSFTASEASTVHDLMVSLKSAGKINFTAKNYVGMGEFITSINGVENIGSQNWIYYVNGEKASIGVSNYKIKSGDIVSWKYEKNI